jgi:hypothetical protein
VLAADKMGYDIVLWSDAMKERCFAGDPRARFIVDTVRPGSIVLAHGAGDDRPATVVERGLTRRPGPRRLTGCPVLPGVARH